MDQQPAPPTDNTLPTNTPPAPAAPEIPATWPGAFGVYKISKAAIKLNLEPFLVVAVVAIVLGSASSFILKQKAGNGSFSFIVSAFTSAATAYIFVASVRGRKVAVGESFKAGFRFFFKMLVLSILTTISVIVSFLLLIVPFFFVMPRLILANYYLVDQNLGIMEAYKACWAGSKGHLTKVWGIIGATFLIILLMITVIGIPFSIYFLIMYSAAYAVLYEFIIKRGPANPQAAATPSTNPTPTALPPQPPTSTTPPAPPASTPPTSPGSPDSQAI